MSPSPFSARSLVAALVPTLAASDLTSALRRAAAPAAALPAAAPLDEPFVVPLERVQVNDASFYVGTVHVGHPQQPLQVLFDTASGQVILPHRACSSSACVTHRRYSPWASSTSMDVNVDGHEVQEGERLAQGKVMRDGVTVSYTQSDLGTGDTTAVVVRDSLCLEASKSTRSRACVDLGMLAAIKEDDVPFKAMPNDGIIGLGLESLAISKLNSFVGRLFEGARNVLPQFGLHFRADGGELHVGGHDDARFTEPLRWFPVDHPEEGYWQVAIKAVYVGEHLVDSCTAGCHGIVDTGASRLGVQKSGVERLRAALRAGLAAPAPQQPCRGSPLRLDLGDMQLTLEAEDYTDDACNPQLGELELEEPTFRGVYALGESVLRRYYAAFDWEHRRVGFAQLAQDEHRTAAEIVVF